jgi:hypothetical protein
VSRLRQAAAAAGIRKQRRPGGMVGLAVDRRISGLAGLALPGRGMRAVHTIIHTTIMEDAEVVVPAKPEP